MSKAPSAAEKLIGDFAPKLVDSTDRVAQSELKVVAVTDATQVKSVVKKFRGKYGTSGVSLYSKLDVAVIAQTR
jgi:hypothetical protein